MKRSFLAALVLAGIFGLGFAAGRSGWPALRPPVLWGVDACISAHVKGEEAAGYLDLLEKTPIVWLRERDIAAADWNPRSPGDGESRLETWRRARDRGFRVVGFATVPPNLTPSFPENQLPEDLLAVFRASRALAIRTGGIAAAWEMGGEPEVYFQRDLPDRLVAYNKAVYLGLKAGLSPRERARVPILMGALAFPPGPWLEAAAENGLYDYTDAINFHHYGFAADLTDVVTAQRQVAAAWTGSRVLPLWLTEVGLNNIPYGDPENAAARRQQGEYLVQCARQAMDLGIAVFMPFILVHRGDPFELVPRAEAPRTGWNAYRDFIASHPVPPREVSAPSERPSPIVMQWLPDEFEGGTTHKVSHSYWVDPDDDGEWLPLKGTIRVYNLGKNDALVRLRDRSRDPGLNWENGGPPREISLPAMTRRDFPVTVRLPGQRYGRRTFRFEAELSGPRGPFAPSRLCFTVETPPAGDLPHELQPLGLAPLPQGKNGPIFANIAGSREAAVSGQFGPWVGINGAEVRSSDQQTYHFDVADPQRDPLSPPMAIAALPGGLPFAQGFLRMVATADGEPAFIRVDLIDCDGQRFSVVEDLGRNRFREATAEVFLAWRDFHPWVFGRCVAGKSRLDPARVREIQLRFFGAERKKTFRVHLEAVKFLPNDPLHSTELDLK